MTVKHVVVDGSNLATEGRTLPSLQQLDDAVRAYLDEFEPETVTVMVDATFPKRIDESELPAYEAALEAGELLVPPAGVIGRGDAFLLQVADRVDAVVLSNDSFQEFHGQYTWLFDQGRLVGGKPVPPVGWVFMDRSPVRGPTSRRAISDAKKSARAKEAPADEPAERSGRAGASDTSGAKRTGSRSSAKKAPTPRTPKGSKPAAPTDLSATPASSGRSRRRRGGGGGGAAGGGSSNSGSTSS